MRTLGLVVGLRCFLNLVPFKVLRRGSVSEYELQNRLRGFDFSCLWGVGRCRVLQGETVSGVATSRFYTM